VHVVIEFPEIVYLDVFCRENVVVLKMALYGLKQALLLWCERLSGDLLLMGFGRCEVDPCVYARKVGFCIVAVYVNDLWISGENDGAVEIAKRQMTHHYMMTDMGEPKEIVGWNITKISNGITTNQSSFIRPLTQ
jgi:Reverse transcriptase (RNA-dependent DNA polymerase)